MSNYCPRCGEPACFCGEGAKRPSAIWNGMFDAPHDENLTVTAIVDRNGDRRDRETGLGPKDESDGAGTAIAQNVSDNQLEPSERVTEMQDVYDLIIATCQDDPEFHAWGASALRFLNALTRSKQTEPLGLERLTEILSERRLPGTRNGPITEPRDLAEHILASLKGNQHGK